MLLHRHHAEDPDGNQIEVYVLHAAPSEAQFLANSLAAALINNPDVPSYSITLGTVADLDSEPEPIIEIVSLPIQEEVEE